jgi:hypothetical protein
MVHTNPEFETPNLILDFEFDQHLESHKHVINIIMWFRDMGCYKHLTKEDYGPGYKRVWKEKMLEKIKIFMWLMEERSNLTKDNMLKRNWQSDPCCYFYDEPEDTDHLFF